MTGASGMSSTGRRHALLGARARRLARPRGEQAVASTPCLVCEAAGGLYGLPLAGLSRVIPFVQAAWTPSANPALLGAIARSGVFYHLFDLGMLLGGRAALDGGHAVLLRALAPAISLRVDRALHVAELVELSGEEASRMTASHPAVKAFARPLESGLFEGRTVALVDIDLLTSDAQRRRGEGELSVDQ